MLSSLEKLLHVCFIVVADVTCVMLGPFCPHPLQKYQRYFDIIGNIWWRIRATCWNKKSCKGL